MQTDELVSWRALVIQASLLCLLAGPSHAASKDDLFLQVFGSKAAEATDQTFQAPIAFLLYELGPVTVLRRADGSVHVKKDALIEVLDPLLTDVRLGDIKALPESDGYLAIGDIDPDVLTLIYDPSALALNLTVPWQNQEALDISLITQRARPTTPAFSASDVSAILNLRGSLDLQSNAGPDTETLGWGLSVDPALQLHGVVLEGNIEAGSALAPRTQVRRVRLFYDHVDLRLRYEMGDVDFATTGFQVRPPLAGLAISRDFSLSPERAFRPRGDRFLSLDRNSTIEVMSNGQAVDTIALPPGRYRLTDLPLVIGRNDYTLQITDDQNQRRIVEASLFFDPGLLAGGESDFSLAAGLETVPDGAYQSADPERWVASAFYRRGVTSEITLGAGVQAGRESRNFAFDFTTATGVGNFAVLGDWSHTQDRQGIATAVQWDVPGLFSRAIGSLAGDSYTDLTVLASYTTRNYTPFTAELEEQDRQFDITARLSQDFGQALQVALTSDYQTFRQSDDLSRVTADIRVRLGERVSVGTSASVERRAGETDSRVLLDLVVPFADNKALLVNSALPDRQVDATLTRTQRRPVDDWSGTLTYRNTQTTDAVEASQRFTGQRFEVDTRQDWLRQRETGTGSSESQLGRGSIALGTAAVYAGGTVALSRPVGQSFAIVRRNESFHGTDILVNRSGDAYLARSDGLGPLVLPDLSDHLEQSFRLDAPDLEIGMDLGNETPRVRPLARSGVRLAVGTPATVILSFQVVDDQGTPLALKAAQLVRTGAPDDKRQFFTNREGRAVVDGLQTGTYMLRVLTDKSPRGRIVVSTRDKGLVKLGAVEVSVP